MLKDTKLSTIMKREAHPQNISKHNMKPENPLEKRNHWYLHTAYHQFGGSTAVFRKHSICNIFQKKWHVQICRPSSNISKHLNLSHQARGAGSEELRMPVEDLSWQICPVWVRVWNTFSGLKTIPGPSDRPGPEWTFAKYCKTWQLDTCWQTPMKNSTVLNSLIIPGCFEHVLHLICYSYPVLRTPNPSFKVEAATLQVSFTTSFNSCLKLVQTIQHAAVTSSRHPGMSFRCLPRRAGCPGSSLT